MDRFQVQTTKVFTWWVDEKLTLQGGLPVDAISEVSERNSK